MKGTSKSFKAKKASVKAEASDELSSSSTSWDGQDDQDNCALRQQHDPSVASGLHVSLDQRAGVRSNEDLTGTGSPKLPQPLPPQGQDTSIANDNGAFITEPTTDQERQLLLLMLLAQVCALHDPTPRTFTVHVLELFERGMLDRDSIHFLFELGLVPSNNATLHPQSSSETAQNLALVVPTAPTNHRSLEASAIRMKLESLELQQHEQERPFRLSQSVPDLRPWSVEAHPLSLSHYQREFIQNKVLGTGAFGQCFHATSKMDGLDYAIKRVAFSARGYSRDSVKNVVREVHCLAVCDHPNVVRYYSSWLEPSWMTGSGSTAEHTGSRKRELLMGAIQRIVSRGTGDSRDLDSDILYDYFKDPDYSNSNNSGSRHRRFPKRGSFDTSDSSDWTDKNGEYSKDDSYLGDEREGRQPVYARTSGDDNVLQLKAWKVTQPKRAQSVGGAHRHYSYQMSLFIQMQLCHASTLADWIRERNLRQSDENITSRLETAATIFEQIVRGLVHVHEKGIVHRDLKPANCFVEGSTLKIGDFGLSKLIEGISHADLFDGKRNTKPCPRMGQAFLLETDKTSPSDLEKSPVPNKTSTWNDPLTAGVGTASYAAPEQVSTRSYGKEADIFSLGLILLELLCRFSTEHERLQTFHDCRARRTLPEELDGYPDAARTILACTEHNPRRRPSAESLLGLDIRHTHRSPTDCPEVSADESIMKLEQRLAEKEQELRRCQDELLQKDRVIQELISRLSQEEASSFPFVGTDDDGSDPASSSGSDEDEL
jgi:eukaryotic translation initiation factor 2-alpha kinase 1